MTLGGNIRELRKCKGYSILKLRELTGLSKSTISDIENDKSSPSVLTIQKIAEALGTTVNELLTTEEKLDIAMDVMNTVTNLAKDALSNNIRDYEDSIYSVCGKFDKEKFTNEEQTEIVNFIQFLISKRNK